MWMNELFANLRTEGKITAMIGDVPITFDLRFTHERRYAASAVLHIKYPQKDIDTALYAYLLRTGDRVLDLGANIGLTALEALQLGAAHVTCVEPVSALAARIPVDPRISTICAAVFDYVGEADLTMSDHHNQGATLEADTISLFPREFSSRAVEIVKTIKIDGLGIFDIWKIDVEGAEAAAIRGARNILDRSPPRVIIVEIYDNFLAETVELIIPSHPVVRRAGLTVDDYSLELVTPSAFDQERYHPTSPMYVFEQAPCSPTGA